MEDLPKKSNSRVALEKASEAVASAVPFVGGPLAIVLVTAMNWSISRRTDDWLEALAAEVKRQGLVLEDLADQPPFVDAVVTATRAAQATHQKEKLEALRNGVLHSVGQEAPDVDEQARFFRLVEEFTAGHLSLLSFLDDPAGTFDRLGLERPNIYMGGRGDLVEHLPGFGGRRDWYALLLSDLDAAKLANIGNLGTTMTGAGMWQRTTTPLGHRFLRFISP